MLKLNVYKVLFSALICIGCTNCTDQICINQREPINTAFKKTNPISKFIFFNESKTSLEITWLGENSGKIILVTTSKLLIGQIDDPSDVYLSENNGKTFTKITDRLPKKKIVVGSLNGLQRSTVDTNMAYLVCYDSIDKSSLIITHNAGVTWHYAKLDFVLDKQIVYHPRNKLWLLTLCSMNNLYKSEDGGLTWIKLLDNVYQFQWSTMPRYSNVIIAKVGPPQQKRDLLQILLEKMFPRQRPFTVKKYDGKTWTVINTKIYGFLMIEKFLYMSELISGNRRRLIVSVDEGKTFNRVYLPTIVDQQFYSILDIEDNLVFIHVDNQDANGDGTLFTSDSDGRIFSQSLLNHFYPSQSYLSDFYKVQSMRGTYMASQLKPDKSIQTLITFNRGAEWKKLIKPPGVPCQDIGKIDCTLQIANGYSALKHVMAYLPLSSPTAVGLILAHGHVAASLKTSKADVYISSDGGYNWMKSLDGPHQYVIADHGGLIIALGENSTVIKFSTDEGRCWHQHQYTTDDIKVTGLLTEPGNKAMTVAIWGYLSTLNQWVVHVVDLSQVLNRECNDADYEEWFAHSEMLHPSGKEYIGCLLGKKETFLRLKKDSLCKNGYSHKIKKSETKCSCTEDDFECEYGYYRTVNSKQCIRNKYIQENLCVKGFEDKILTQGYKKIPSDECEGGFMPKKTEQRMLKTKCNEDDNSWKEVVNKTSEDVIGKQVVHKNSAENNTIAKSLKNVEVKSSNVIFIIVGVVGTLIVFFVIFVVAIRTRNIRRRQANLKYRVLAGLDRQTHEVEDDDAALLSHEIGYESLEPCQLNSSRLQPEKDDDVDLIG